ncbi:hypothetical protein CHUAL_004045 [Chamberlinius hualienensis]
MSKKLSAFAMFTSKTKLRKSRRGKLKGALKKLEIPEIANNRNIKKVGQHTATPYQLTKMTRSPKVYIPNSAPESPFLGESSSCTSQTFEALDSVESTVTNKKKEVNGQATKKSPKKKKKRATVKESAENNVQPVEFVEVTPTTHYMFDSRLEGAKCFEWLLHPTKPDKFFNDLWEKRPLLVKRNNPNYYKGLFSMDHLDHILRHKIVWFGKNIDITTYENGKRETHNPPGRAYAPVVWDFYQNGCSVRLLNPQTFSTGIWKLNSTLQEFFENFVGANIYLTPPGSQGFAPHYDDIEAFVLQLEGAKRWRLYAPRNQSETLPRFSSVNFKEEDIGQPMLDVLLQAGDLLYFPRGTIHQAVSPPDTHSLHITVSTCQKNSWGDFLELLIPRALEIAVEEDVEFRQSVPRNFLGHLGVANSDLETDNRGKFMSKIQKLMTKLIQYAPVDAAADQMAKKNIHDFLPPVITKFEEQHSIHGRGERCHNGSILDAFEMEPDSKIKLIRGNLLRLVMEENAVRVYYYMENSREYHKESEQFIEINPLVAPAVEYLGHSYPNFITVESLPLDDLESKMEIANILFERGLILVENIEPNISD